MRKYLTSENKKDIERYCERIENHMSELWKMTREFIDNEDESYNFEFKDYARIDDKLQLIYMELHYLREVVKS